MTCHSKVALCLVLLLASARTYGASFLVPTDRELVDRADAIVVGTVAGSGSLIDSGGRVITVSSIAVSEVLKGNVQSATIEVTEQGGAVGDVGVIVSGAPIYAVNERVLIFLEGRQSGFRTWGLALGKFDFVTTDILARGEIFGFTAAEASTSSVHATQKSFFTSFVPRPGASKRTSNISSHSHRWRR